MIRRIALVASAATLAFASLGIGAANGAVPPPTGKIHCTLSGTATLTPALTSTPSTKAIKLKATGTLSACDNSGVTGGKAPITAGTIKVSGSIPVGQTCLGLLTPVLGPTKTQVKWQGLNPAGKPMTVAVDKTTVASITLSFTPIGFKLVSAPITKGAFSSAPNNTITSNVVLDEGANLLTDCNSPTGLTTMAFTGGPPTNLPSSISVP